MIIFKHSLKRIFKNKIRLLLLLIMPVLFIVMFALQDQRSMTIGIADKDNSTLSKRLASNLIKMQKVKVLMIKEDVVYDKTVSYQIDYALIIEPGFEEKIIKGENPSIGEFYLAEREKLFYAKNITETFISNMKMLSKGAGYNKETFMKELEKYDNANLQLENLANKHDTTPNTRAAMGFLMQFMLYMSVVTAGLLLEDKNNGVYYRTFYGPVTLKRYIAENLSAFLMVGVIQVTMVFILIKVLFGLDMGKHPMALYTLFLMFSLVCVSLGMWLVSMFKKPIGAYTAIMLLTTPFVMLGGGYWPMNFMPEILQKIAHFLPTTWVMEGTEKIIFDGSGIAGISIQLLVLLIFSGIFMSAGLVKKVDISK
jgi:ABC-2 type transport system permease protein